MKGTKQNGMDNPAAEGTFFIRYPHGTYFDAGFSPLTASAHFAGDKWDRGGQWLLKINYGNKCSPSSFERAAYAAANDWTAISSAPSDFLLVNNGNCQPFDNQLDIFTGYDSNAGHLAWTQNYTWSCILFVCNWQPSWSGTIGHSVIRINTNSHGSFSSLSPFDQEGALVHEMGHTQGLDHSGAGDVSIMNPYCCQGYNVPQQHDINDIRSLYP